MTTHRVHILFDDSDLCLPQTKK